ncbi:hypothetical protein NE865_10356 [Phthorimaea operculella]|nr:hypothetical protein NE865_10356 [Phthorimaea operculella]
MALDISTLLKLIPPFDTNQPEQVYRFVRSCNSAFELAQKDQGQILLVYALNNITGSGASDVHSKQHASWDVLRSYLIERFSNVKTISHLNLELQSMFQKPNETLIEYFHRVDLCRSKIIEKLTAEISDNTLEGRKATTEETALSVFVNGVGADMSTMLRTKGFNTLTEAGRFAIQEDKIRAMNNARQALFKNSNPRPPTLPSRPAQRTFYNNHRPPPPNQNRSPTINNNISTSTNTKICNYCKNIGHVISECRKRAYNNNLRNENNAQRALPAPPARINNLNSLPTNEESSSLGIGSKFCSTTQIQTSESNLINLQLDH